MAAAFSPHAYLDASPWPSLATGQGFLGWRAKLPGPALVGASVAACSTRPLQPGTYLSTSKAVWGAFPLCAQDPPQSRAARRMASIIDWGLARP